MSERLLVLKGVIEHSGKAVHINNTVCALLHRLSSFTVLVDICNKWETSEVILSFLKKVKLRLREIRLLSRVRLVKA